MKKIKLGAQINTIRNFIKTIDDFKISMKKLKEIGYAGVQLDVRHIAPGYDLDFKLIADILNQYELLPTNTHLTWDFVQNNFSQTIEIHNQLGCSHLAIPMITDDYRRRGELGYIDFAKEIVSFSEKFSKYGISLSYHNHSFEFERFSDKTGIEIIFENVGNTYLRAEIDTYWVQHAGADPAFWIEKLKHYSPVIHFKDMAIYAGKQTFAPVGQGNLNWERIISSTSNSSIEWIVVEQDLCFSDPFDCLTTSYRFLNRYGFDN